MLDNNFENSAIKISIKKKSHSKLLKENNENYKNIKVKTIDNSNLNVIKIQKSTNSDTKLNQKRLNLIKNHFNSGLKTTVINGNEEEKNQEKSIFFKENQNKSILFKDLVISNYKNNFSSKELALIIKNGELNKKHKIKGEMKKEYWNSNNIAVNSQTVTIKSVVNRYNEHNCSYKNEKNNTGDEKINKNVNNVCNLIKNKFLCCLS